GCPCKVPSHTVPSGISDGKPTTVSAHRVRSGKAVSNETAVSAQNRWQVSHTRRKRAGDGFLRTHLEGSFSAAFTSMLCTRSPESQSSSPNLPTMSATRPFWSAISSSQIVWEGCFFHASTRDWRRSRQCLQAASPSRIGRRQQTGQISLFDGALFHSSSQQGVQFSSSTGYTKAFFASPRW